MINANRLFLLLVLGFLPGCHQEQNHFSFKEELILTGVEAKVKGGVLHPLDFIVIDSLLLIKEPPHRKKLLKILNLNDFSLISNAVWLGRGPGEMVIPAHWDIDNENRILRFSDWGKHSIFMFPIDSLVSNPDFYATDYVSLDRALIPMMNMFYHPSGNSGFTSFNLQQNLVSFIDKQGQLVDSLVIPNKFNRDFWANSGFADNPLILHYNPCHNKIVVAARFENFIAVIDEEGNPIFQLEPPPLKSESRDEYRTFYAIRSNQDFIYCLYIGGQIRVYNKEMGRIEMIYPKKLLVFDWKGIARYEVNLNHGIMSFTVDAERERLIGSTQEFENGLVIYDLSALKKK